MEMYGIEITIINLRLDWAYPHVRVIIAVQVTLCRCHGRMSRMFIQPLGDALGKFGLLS